ncbi:methylated-DNA--protein-cysteine methyltransferase [Angustibacter aerolatus]|uniref:Methylated-DNA--protein-cysteine methyltransferase n=1 Tax=Angustibacter aerolatus TaxID=1162965 RepID=A0ABQ6JJH2_9ACTN|nr:methylated-DNA--protein-cysteine methyltransferase [Angustibacter aerolatus]
MRRPRLVGDVAYVVEETVLGRMLLAARSDGPAVTAAFVATDADVDTGLRRLAATISPRVLRGGRTVDTLRAALGAYLDGSTRGLEVDTDLSLLTPFQRQVLTTLRDGTGYGQRTTYGALAAAVGRPKAARAVGAALGANPLCVVLPCHRVVAGTGRLTGYAGGLAAKELLLDLESRGAVTAASGASGGA